MRFRPSARAVISTVVRALILLGVFVPVAFAQCPGNIAINPGLDDGFSTRDAGEVNVANGWQPFWQDGPGQDEGYNRRPEFQPEDASRFGRRRIHEGNWAQKIMSTFSTHHAGLWQQINVPVGSTVRFSAWAQAWSSSKDDPSYSVDGAYGTSIGIDPTGGTDWTSPSIVWSGKNWTLDQWVQHGVETQARAGTVTIYLRGDAEWRVKHNDGYWDDICVTFQAPPTPLPRPTSPPPPPPTATPEAGSEGATPTDTAPSEAPPPTEPPPVAGGTIRVSAFDDLNGNGVRDQGEPQLAGAVIEVTNMQGNLVAARQTDGSSEPFAIQGLPAGSYVVAERDPPGYVSTSQNEWAVTLLEGGALELQFGDRFNPSPTPLPTRQPTSTPVPATPTPEPQSVASKVGDFMYGVSGVLLALIALVLPITLRILRSR